MIDKYITIKECTGCKMCGDLCPQKAISFANNEAFWLPKVDYEKCIDCKLCINRCPAISPINIISNKDEKAFGAWHTDEKVRYKSTSGGFFTAIGTHFINSLKGVVVGAAYTADFLVEHIIVDRIEDLSKLRQSKYLQSDTKNIYIEVKNLLRSGRNVLFTGTSCQVAALYSFLNRHYDNLYTIDLICLGIPSPLVFRKYLDWLEKEKKSKVTNVWFKYKAFGWSKISNRIDFENGKSYICTGNRDPYMISFVRDYLNIRPNCDNCKYRKVPHMSDFTLGDFWGVEKVLPNADDDKGISAVIANSKKGRDLMELLSESLIIKETTLDDIARGNFTLYNSAQPSVNRANFLSDITKFDFITVLSKYSKYYPIPFIDRLHYIISNILKLLKF